MTAGPRRPGALPARLLLGVGVLLTGAGTAGHAAAPAQSRAAAPTAEIALAVSQAAGAAAPTSPTSDPTPALPASDRGLPLRVAITSLTPRVPRPGSTLRVRGVLTNVSRAAVEEVQVRLRVSSDAIGTRTALAASPRATGPFGVAVDAAGAGAPVARSVPPGVSVRFDVRVPVVQLGLGTPGVYPFGVEARSSVQGGTTVGRIRTVLPLLAAKPDLVRTPLAWVWPLVTPPQQEPDGTLRSDALAGLLAPGGRLGTLAAAAARNAAAGRPLTLAVDPSLLDAAASMRTSYTVRPPGRAAVRGTGSAAAQQWLTAVTSAAAAGPLLALPYADPDLRALTGAGMAAEIGPAVRTGRDVVRQVLGREATPGLAWPPDGVVNRATIDALSALPVAVDSVVLSGRTLPPGAGLRYTPGAAATVRGDRATLRAAVSDATLDTVVAGGVGSSSAARRPGSGALFLAEQRFLAETYLITLEKPHTARPLVITPPRGWNPSAGYASAVLADTATVPWLQPATVPQVASAPTSDPRAGLRSAPVRRPLPPRYLHGVRRVRRELTGLQSILVADYPPSRQLERAVFRLESAAWRGHVHSAGQLRERTGTAVQTRTSAVRITTSGLITLTSRSGKLAFTVTNRLPTPVRVQLRLGGNDARIVARDSPLQTVAPGHSVQLEARYVARSTGVFPVQAALFTPTGAQYSTPVTISVRSTAYGTVALGITGGAFAVLVLGVAVRLVRRGLRAHRRTRSA